MADITVPHVFTDGSPIGSTEFNANLFKRIATPASAAVLNGKLDEANIDFSTYPAAIERRHVYRYADIYVSSTAKHVDYPRTLFTDSKARSGEQIPVLGTGIRFYLRNINMTVILFGWCNVTCDLRDNSGVIEIPLMLDGVKTDLTLNTLGNSFASSSGAHEPYFHTRQYQFHRLRVNLSKGWHTLSLGIFSEANMLRFRNRGCAVIAFP